jgi:hypothetical protein
MQVKAHVIGEHREDYSWKRGKGVHFILLCMDCDTEMPLDQIFEYVMTAEESEEYFGRLRERIVMLGISKLEPAFGWRFRARGKMTVLSPLKPRSADSKKDGVS